MILPEKFRAKNFKIHGVTLDAFEIPFQGRSLIVLATIEPNGWERVSVSLSNRTPNWPEMCFIKNLFWGEDEFCIQLHPRKKDYINLHAFCLHIFKPPASLQEQIEVICNGGNNYG